MAEAKTFKCSVVTPEKVVLECDARFVALPAHDGEIGLLRGRAPIVCKLDIGQLRVETESGKESFFIDGGFAEMAGNSLTVLTEDARRSKDIDRQAAQKSLEEAQAMPGGDPITMAAREKSLKRARTQLRLASS